MRFFALLDVFNVCRLRGFHQKNEGGIYHLRFKEVDVLHANTGEGDESEIDDSDSQLRSQKSEQGVDEAGADATHFLDSSAFTDAETDLALDDLWLPASNELGMVTIRPDDVHTSTSTGSASHQNDERDDERDDENSKENQTLEDLDGPGDREMILYMGIIDTLTEYHAGKISENFVKELWHGKNVSCTLISFLFLSLVFAPSG